MNKTENQQTNKISPIFPSKEKQEQVDKLNVKVFKIVEQKKKGDLIKVLDSFWFISNGTEMIIDMKKSVISEENMKGLFKYAMERHNVKAFNIEGDKMFMALAVKVAAELGLKLFNQEKDLTFEYSNSSTKDNLSGIDKEEEEEKYNESNPENERNEDLLEDDLEIGR